MSAKDAANRVVCRTAIVVSNRRVARDTFCIRILESGIAKSILPGQFVMLRSGTQNDPLLARPYALYDTACGVSGEPEAIDLVYLVLGNGTRALSRVCEGASLDIWGPLGRPFPSTFSEIERQHLLLVAGGIGQTPFVAVTRELVGRRTYGQGRTVDPPNRISLAWGVRQRDYLVDLDLFRTLGVDVHLATNDGSLGHHGYVTDVVKQLFCEPQPPTAIFGCGPEPMLSALAQVAQDNRVPCWVSLETKMACGYGVCFSCVCPVIESSGWDYRRVCVEGPVFRSDQIAWNAH